MICLSYGGHCKSDESTDRGEMPTNASQTLGKHATAQENNYEGIYV
jgi:hypothetical protein